MELKNIIIIIFCRIPADWMAEELSSNPELARFIIRRFIDVDQDGLVSPVELLRNTVCQEPN